MEFITVSCHPTERSKQPLDSLKEFDIVMNVSDHVDFQLNAWLCAESIQQYWFPMGEAHSLPLENLFGAMQVLWNAENTHQKVFLHCVAGRNRSQMIKDCYRFMTTGEYDEKSSMMLNVYDNQLPGIYRLELFLQKCLALFQDPAIAEGELIDWLKRETFYF